MFVFVDTCIFIELFICSDLFNKFRSFLRKNNYKLLVADFLFLELGSKQEYVSEYIKMIEDLPYALAIPSYDITLNEIKNYPRGLSRPIDYYELAEPSEVLKLMFTSEQMAIQRKEHQLNKPKIVRQIYNGFSKSNTYDPLAVAYSFICNNIKKIDSGFFERISQSGELLNVEAFPSECIRSYIAYEKYLVDKKKPEETDMGDFLLMSFLPYCTIGFVENQMCNYLNKIKRVYSLSFLDNIDFKNMSFIRNNI